MPIKSQLDAIHPDLHAFASKMPRMTFSSKNLWLWRLLDYGLWIRKPPPDVHIENILIPRRDRNTRIRLRVYRPEAKSPLTPAMLWLHGGGYIIGSPAQDDACCAQYVRELGIAVVSVDYRRAPEHPFPSALDDSFSTWMWLCAQAGQLGFDVHRFAVGGASAGGGLAAALVQLLHDRKEIQPLFQLLVYPMLDDRTTLRSDLAHIPPLAWSQESNRFGWQAYLGTAMGAPDVPPYAVPSRRADLTGLPPAWIGVGTLDIFHDEAVAYGQQLMDCGVPCQMVIVPGAFHGFDVAGLKVPLVRDFRRSQIEALHRHLLPGN